MLEWTGERYLPWIKDPAIAYEHLHRYAFAKRFARGKRVLDLASGEGYGSNMLAADAQFVLGVEIDKDAFQHARQKYSRSNLEFVSGSATRVSIEKEHTFDVVVCFEVIEHINDQRALVAEARRMLAPGGVFLVSTPNKTLYQEHTHEDNPYHVHELEFDEFRGLLEESFPNVGFFGQRIHAGSNIWPLGNSGAGRANESVVERSGPEFEFVGGETRAPLYFIAIASDAALPAVTGDILTDASHELLEDKDRQVHELLQTKVSNESALQWQERLLADRAATITSLEKAVEWHQGEINALKQGLMWKDTIVHDAQATIASHEKAIAWLSSVNKRFEEEHADLNRRLGEAMRELELIHASRGWRFILWLRRLRGRR